VADETAFGAKRTAASLLAYRNTPRFKKPFMKSTTKSLLVLAAMLLIASAQPIATPAAEELPLPKELRDAEQRTWQQAPPATEADEAKPAEPTEPPADAPQPPAAEEPKPEKEQARRAWDWLKRVTGASSGDTPGKFERNHPTIKTAFRDAVAPAAHSVVQVQCNGKRRAMGTVVDSGGFVLTKASQLTGKLACRDAEGRQWDATVVGTLAEHDLAMLKIDTTELSAAAWDEGETPPVGSWLATPGAEATPLSIGVVSTASRSVFKSSALLGVVLEQTDDGPEVTQVLPDSGAEKAEVKQGDRIVKIDDQQVESREQLIAHIRGLRPGHQVKLTVQRGDEQLELTATLGKRPEMPQLDLGAFQNRLGGRLSRRRTDFPSVFQHDTVLRPDQCGGPVLDLDGKAVGVNIARAGRVASYAIPASVVVPLLDDLKSGKYAPAVQPEVAEQLDDLKAKIARLKKQLTEAKSAAGVHGPS